MNEEELDRMLIGADPARTPESAQLTPAQVSVRDRIMASQAPVRRARPALILMPPAAILVLVVAVVGVMLPAQRAQAGLTPEPLSFSNSEGITVEEVAALAVQQLRSENGPSQSRQTHTTGWFLQVTELPKGARTIAISPQVTTTSWEPDGSGRVQVIAGEPYWADGTNTAVSAGEAPTAGTELMNTIYNPGEMGVPPVEPTGDSPEDMLSLLHGLGMPETFDAADIMDFTDNAMRWWTFTNAQHVGLVQLLLSRDDVRVLGTAQDRAGREIIGSSADSAGHPDIRTTVLISAESGRIVGTESTRTTPDGEIPVGAVVAYTMWEVQ